ncbi:unnamed protein product, partial [Polarella glacialis]
MAGDDIDIMSIPSQQRSALLAECMAGEEDPVRKEAYLNFKKQMDSMKEEHEGGPSEVDKLKGQGNHFFSFGCYSQATTLYTMGLDMEPKNTVLLNNRAMSYLKQDMPEEALADADISIALDSTVENIKAFWRRAQALLEMARDDEAERAANAGLALQANNGHLNRVRKKAREASSLRMLCGCEWVGKLDNGVEKRMSFTKDGVMLMTVIGHELKAKFDLSVECTPKTMVVKMGKDGMEGGGPPPPPMPYIYEFHDDGK